MRPALALVLLTACGGADDVGRTTGGPLRAERPAPVSTSGGGTPTVVAPGRPPRPAGRPFAETPLSGFAEAMTDLALAALEGRPLPSSPIAMQPGPVTAVVWEPPVERAGGPYEVLGFAFEVELVLKHGERRPEATGPDRWGSVHAVIGVTRHGLRLVELRPRRVRPPGPPRAPPPGMEGLTEVAGALITDLRRGDVSAWELGEPDRVLLGNDDVWSQVQHDRPRSIHLQELANVLTELPDEPLSYLLGDLAVLVVPPDGRLLSLALELVPGSGDGAAGRQGVVLRTDPIVEVGQVWPVVAPGSVVAPSSVVAPTSSTGP